jgi:hypothetical protein
MVNWAICIADFFQIAVRQILDLLGVSDATPSQILRARVRPMPKMAVRPISACLMLRNVDTSDTCHVRPLIFPLNLGAACDAGSVQITRTTPLRRMILQLRQIFLTEAETLISFS